MSYYQTLELTRDASSEQIREAYKTLAKKYHPDKNSQDKENEKRFEQIQRSYSILSNPEKRKLYDSLFLNSNDNSTQNFDQLQRISENEDSPFYFFGIRILIIILTFLLSRYLSNS